MSGLSETCNQHNQRSRLKFGHHRSIRELDLGSEVLDRGLHEANRGVPVGAGELAGRLLRVDNLALTGQVRCLEDQDLEVASDSFVHEELILESIRHRFFQLFLELDGVLAVASATTVLDSEHSFGVGGVAEDFGGNLNGVHLLS